MPLILHTEKVRSQARLSLDAQLIKLRESNLTASGTCFVIQGGIGTAVYFSWEEVCVRVSAREGCVSDAGITAFVCVRDGCEVFEGFIIIFVLCCSY